MATERLLERSIPDRSPGHAFMAMTNWGGRVDDLGGGNHELGDRNCPFSPVRHKKPDPCSEQLPAENVIY